MSSKFLNLICEKQENGNYKVKVEGEVDVFTLDAIIEGLHSLTDSEDELFVTTPVVEELEDPKLVAELKRRLQSIEDGTAKTIPLESVLGKFGKVPENGVKIVLSDESLQDLVDLGLLGNEDEEPN